MPGMSWPGCSSNCSFPRERPSHKGFSEASESGHAPLFSTIGLAISVLCVVLLVFGGLDGISRTHKNVGSHAIVYLHPPAKICSIYVYLVDCSGGRGGGARCVRVATTPGTGTLRDPGAWGRRGRRGRPELSCALARAPPTPGSRGEMRWESESGERGLWSGCPQRV